MEKIQPFSYCLIDYLSPVSIMSARLDDKQCL